MFPPHYRWNRVKMTLARVAGYEAVVPASLYGTDDFSYRVLCVCASLCDAAEGCKVMSSRDA